MTDHQQHSFSSAWRLLAVLAYPSLIVVALWLQQPSLRALGLPLLAIALVGLWPSQRFGQWVLFASIGLAFGVVLRPDLALWLPSVFCLAVAAWFGLSMRPGHCPLIARFALLVHAQQGQSPPPDAAPWLKYWTGWWSLILAWISAVAIVLIRADQALLWLLWMLGVLPTVMVATLIAEYGLRRRRFPDYDHGSLGQFLLALTRIRPEQLLR